jgi:hypothetical protein
MTTTDRYDQHVLGAADPGRPSPTVRRTRAKLLAFAAISLLAPVVGLPIWTLVALLATTLAIPIAAHLHGLPPLFGARLPGRTTVPGRARLQRSD